MLLFGKPNVKKMKERKDIEGLFKSLEYGDWRKPKDLEVRVAAAEALAELSDPSVINRLVEMLRHNQVPRAALVKIGIPAVERLITALEKYRNDPKVIRDNPYLDTLADIGDPRVEDFFIKELSDKDERIRNNAARTLMWRDERYMVDVWANALTSEDERMRKCAVRALLSRDESCKVDVLINSLTAEEERIHNSAAKALVSMGEPAVEPLIAVLEKGQDGSGDTIANLLYKIGTPVALDAQARYLSRKREKEAKIQKKQMIADGLELPESPYKEKIKKLIPQNYDRNKRIEQELIEIGRPVIPSIIDAMKYYANWVKRSEEIQKAYPESEHAEWQVWANQSAWSSAETILKGITGKDFGSDYRAWKKWWQQEKTKE